jgi:hypothetical protein
MERHLGLKMSVTLTALGLALGLLGTAAAWIAIKMAKGPDREARRSATVDEFVATRQYLKEHIRELVGTGLIAHRAFCDDSSLPLLAQPGWILEKPVHLSTAVLHRVECSPSISTEVALKILRRYWPLRANGERMESYHEAFGAYDRPSGWFNGASYRMLEITPKAGTLEMTFTDTWYWENIDTTESLLYEAAIMHARSGGQMISGPYRRFLGNPFDFTRRCATPGIDAITIRLEGGHGTFYVIRRDASQVVSAANVTGIVPAGEFQPSDDSWAAKKADFDLWRSIMREYVEEFLDLEDARVRVGTPINFLEQPTYSLLSSAYSSHKIKPFLLGVGLDPVNWKPTILTVCVFPGRLFDKLFSDMVSSNHEGLLELPTRQRALGRPLEGWPFDEETVFAYANDAGVLPAARAGLMLAWRHRSAFGIST